MRSARRRALLALTCLLGAPALGGCSDVAGGQRDQQAVLAYELRIGELNAAAAARPATAPRAMRDQLASAVRQYGAVPVPAVMRPTHRRLMRALRAQLRSLRDALSAQAVGDADAIARARRRNTRAQSAVLAALRRMAAVAQACRASLTACSPAVGAPSSSARD